MSGITDHKITLLRRLTHEIKDKILQPFFTTKKGTQGTGLGLTIAHDIIKSHGMEMGIETEPGRTAFRIKMKTKIKT